MYLTYTSLSQKKTNYMQGEQNFFKA